VTAVELTNLERVLWPRAQFTKGDLVEYYRSVADVLVPHLAGRPLTLWRFPEGVDGPNWWQNECRGAPPWLTTREWRGQRFCVVDDARSLLWIANLGTIELHPFLHRDGDAPDTIVFDLDPGPPATLVDCCEVALLVRERVGGVAKTSGRAGLHVYARAEGRSYTETKALARGVAAELASADERVTAAQSRAERRGRVLVDWLQNDRTRSTIAPYSLRGTQWPTVSAPVTWEEVERCARERRPSALTFLATDVAARLERHGDLFAEVLPTDHKRVARVDP
jgi:bifunctional non-homologous end joining protein LigD